jgi:chemotaxis protein methyltransferase CheR
MNPKIVLDKQARTASLLDKEADLEFLYRKAPFGLCIWDRELRYVRINEFLAKINGKSVEEHVGRLLEEIVSEFVQRVEPFCRQVMDTGEPALDIEIQVAEPAEPSIQKCWLVSFYPIKGKDRAVHGVSVIVLDITKRKEAEQHLLEEKQFSDTVIEGLPGLFFMIDEQGRHIRWNKNTEIVYGYSAEEMANLSGTVDVIAPEDRPKVKAAAERAFQGRSGYCEYSLVTKDNRKLTYAGDSRRITIRGVNYLVGMEIDVTKRTQAENKLKKALSEIKQLKNQVQAENVYLLEQIKLGQGFDEIVCQGHALKQVLFKVTQVAPTNTTVIILGETGTGKDLVAQSIHNSSPRKDRTLVKVNCAALPSNLIESELFGYEKGAFTGANARKIGRFELANDSTIFLDEISELPMELQAKLLKVVEYGEFERLGGTRTSKVNVRIIAATNRNLEEEVRNGRFREDLWYRLNVFPITVPPLRERKEDIAPLVNFFVSKLSRELGKSIRKISKDAMEALQKYHWPGNVRELKNVIERALINTQGSILRLSDRLETPGKADLSATPRRTLEDVERNYIISILEETNWKIAGKNGAAAILGLNPSTLRGRLLKLGIRRQSFAVQQ